jgi:hypothetical protein
MYDVNTLDPKLVTFTAIYSPGSKFEKYETIPFSKIYQPSPNENYARKKGKDAAHIQSLKVCFSHGIDYSQMPPIVYKKHQIIDGVHYDYVLIAGWHRFEALQSLGYDKWIFGVYQLAQDGYSFEESYVTLQNLENNHKAQKDSSEEDISNSIGRLISHGSKLVTKDEDSIRDYVEMVCSNKAWQTKAKIVRMAVRATGAYQDVVSYTADDAFKWINDNTNFVVAGEFDNKRKKYGWTVLEGYEYEYVVSAAKKFAESGKGSYFVCHTKPPTEKKDVNDKREGMLKAFNQLDNALLEVFDYYKKNNKFPWNVEGFLPADKKLGEDELIRII